MLNILMSVNSNYLEKAQTMLFSIHLKVKEEVTVYLLNHRLSCEEIRGFEKYLQTRCKMKAIIIDIKNTALDNLPVGNLNFSIEMYYRIIAQFLLPESLDRIVWLDADIVILNDITEFYYQDFDNKKYIVCADAKHDSKWVQEAKEKMKLPKEHLYFNSGVLLMNLPLLRKDTDMEFIIEQCNLLKERLTYPDQDILNYLYKEDVKYADWERYNYQVVGLKELDKSKVSKIIVLHYCGSDKPWDYWNISSVSKYYWRVRVKEGFFLEACHAYWRKIKELTYEYLKALKGVLL